MNLQENSALFFTNYAKNDQICTKFDTFFIIIIEKGGPKIFFTRNSFAARAVFGHTKF